MVISDLIKDHDLIIYCQNVSCRRGLRLTRTEAIDRFGDDIPLSTIRARARCVASGR